MYVRLYKLKVQMYNIVCGGAEAFTVYDIRMHSLDRGCLKHIYVYIEHRSLCNLHCVLLINIYTQGLYCVTSYILIHLHC